MRLISDNFVDQQHSHEDVDYADLPREAVLELAAHDDEQAQQYLDTHPDEAPAGARAVLVELGLRWEFNPNQPREKGRFASKGQSTPDEVAQAAHDAYERAHGPARRAAIAELVKSSRAASDKMDAKWQDEPRLGRSHQAAEDYGSAQGRLESHGEVGQGILQGIHKWAGRSHGAEAVRSDPAYYRHFLSAAHEGTPTDRELYRSLAVDQDQADEFNKLKPGDVIPTRFAASWTEDREHAERFADPFNRPGMSVRLRLAPGSRALPISAVTPFDEAEWVVGRDMVVNRVEDTDSGPIVHVSTAGDPGNLQTTADLPTGPGEGPVVSPFASKRANQLVRLAARHERRVTGDVTEIARLHEANMEGLEFKLKTERSLARKISNDAANEDISEKDAANKINDILRYTMTVPGPATGP